jgi:hypothetical protein
MCWVWSLPFNISACRCRQILQISFRDGGVAPAWKIHGGLNQRFPHFLNRRFCPNSDFFQGESWLTVSFGKWQRRISHDRFLPNRRFCDNLDLVDIKRIFTRRLSMKNPLDSILGTIISGLVLTLVLYFVVKNFILAGV